MIGHTYISEYITLHEQGKIKLNKERVQLIEYLQTHVLSRDDLYFDHEQIENCVNHIETYFFPLQSFQKFIIPFIFLYRKDSGRLFYRKFLIMMGRGAGKNGLISGLVNYLNSGLHGVNRYNISIVANSEDQAKTSFDEVYDTIDGDKVLEQAFYLTKLKITNRRTKSTLRFRTSNPGSKDGGREGAVVFDEIHQYETAQTVNTLKSGLGKVPYPREFYIGTDGYVRDGFVDKMKEDSARVLKGEEPEANLFPFLCKIDDKQEFEDTNTWEKANPMFSKPMSAYAENLFDTVKEEFQDLTDDPAGKEEFMTKRMNMPEVDLTKTVASWEDISATNRPFPDLENRTCVGAVDFASIRDFAAVGLLFKVDGEYVWKTHSFVRKGFLDDVKLKIPVREFEDRGLLTVVDEPVIQVSNIVNWFADMREYYGIETIVADTFRLDLVKRALEDEGFRVLYIRNPNAISAKLAPRIETLFSNHDVVFGDNPLQRWYTNNVYVRIKKDGNKEYVKKEPYRRKTDGFMAFLYALWQAEEVLDEEVDTSILEDIAF